MRLARTACYLAVLLFTSFPTLADTLRVATFNAELQRKGPGLLLRDIQRGGDPAIEAAIAVIAQTTPDILVLQGFDWDYDGAALSAFADLLAASDVEFPYRFARQPNTGLATGFDLDGDGRLGEPADAQGFGYFTGQGGMAILSRYPILTPEVQDLSPLLWHDLPGAVLPTHKNGTPFPSAAAQAAQRLSSTAHWITPVQVPGWGKLHLLTFHAGPPVFDGPEDRNGRRNHDEIMLWHAVLDGTFGPAPQSRFVLAGDANLDPFDSDGRTIAIRTLLNDHRLQDPKPISSGAAAAGTQGHSGPDAQDTVDWPKVGRLRVDYLLPSQDWTISGAGVFWPAPGQDGHDAALLASRHRLVWVDLLLD